MSLDAAGVLGGIAAAAAMVMLPIWQFRTARQLVRSAPAGAAASAASAAQK